MDKNLEHAPKEGGDSPWGRIDTVTYEGEGIWLVSTPSHGGIKLDRIRNAAVPAYMRREAGWYEEDCDWAIAALVHRDAILDKMLQAAVDNGSAKQTLCHYDPEAYERFTGEIVYPGMSHHRDDEIFHREHANDWVVISAVGDWHEGIPAGYCGVMATVGGQRCQLAFDTAKFFLVPDADYQLRGGHFVVDPARYPETAKF